MSRQRAGFTLLELLLGIAIALMILLIAIPNIWGFFSSRALEQEYEEFDRFVQRASRRALDERRDFVLVWEKEGITLMPDQPKIEDQDSELDQFQFREGMEIVIERPAALMEAPPMEWPFWRSGTCESVIVHYKSPTGTWTAQYDPLTCRGTMLESSQ